MGMLEEDDPIDRFKTWGAKKYIYQKGTKLTCTISGVNKKEGGRELTEVASAEGLDVFETFERGFVFHMAGGQESRYNDEAYGRWSPDGSHQIWIGENLYLQDSTYTVNLTDEYADIISEFQRNPTLCANVLDMWESWEYNRNSLVTG